MAKITKTIKIDISLGKRGRRTSVDAVSGMAIFQNFNKWKSAMGEIGAVTALARSMDSVLSLMQAAMLERFLITQGESRYTKYTQTGATESFILESGSVVVDGEKVILNAFNARDMESYMVMQEKGWDPFVHPQTYVNSAGESKTVDVPKQDSGATSPGPVVVGHSSGLPPGGRKFLLAAFDYWEASGRRDFEKNRVAIFRQIRSQKGLSNA